MTRYAAIFLLFLPTTAFACPSLGCGCHLSELLNGHPIRSDYSARGWLGKGARASTGCVDCIAILSRGRGGHVGIVRGWNGPNPIVYSWGNRRIGWHTQEYSHRRLLGLRSL